MKRKKIGLIERLKYKHDSKNYPRKKWFFYKGIPFIVAEAFNHEWRGLSKLKELKTLRKMYNKNGNWYIVEGAWYWFFGIKGEFCFGDSMHIDHFEMTDEERWQSMIDKAKKDIDDFWTSVLERIFE